MNLVYALIATVLIVIAYATALALAPDWWFASTGALVGVLFAGAVAVFRVYPEEKSEALQKMEEFDNMLSKGITIKENHWDRLKDFIGNDELYNKISISASNEFGRLLLQGKDGVLKTLDGKVLHKVANLREI